MCNYIILSVNEKEVPEFSYYLIHFKQFVFREHGSTFEQIFA